MASLFLRRARTKLPDVVAFGLQGTFQITASIHQAKLASIRPDLDRSTESRGRVIQISPVSDRMLLWQTTQIGGIDNVVR